MSKRKQPDDEASGSCLQKEGPLTEGPIENEYEHLDEDDDEVDEDGVSRTNKMRKDEYEEIMLAQEPSTITREGNIKFTPFNLTEELEDGDFDKAGNFIFKNKDDDESHEGGTDTWAESVDWAEVERKEREKSNEEESKAMQIEQGGELRITSRDDYTCYREMLRLMRSDETVQKTIRRLGSSIPRRRVFNKNARKSQQTSSTETKRTGDTLSIEESKRRLELMIELADQRLRDGDIDIYERTYEDIEEAINKC